MSLAAILLIDLNFAEVRRLEGMPIRIQIVQKSLVRLTVFAVLALVFIVFLNLYQIESLRIGDTSARASLALLFGIYEPLFILRIALVFIGVGWLIFAVTRLVQAKKTLREFTAPIFTSCLIVMIGEILGRFLFYATHVRIGI
jgi:anaerobic dimethyl sulfoxide reductase subunit C (anchor subunit)